MIYYPPVERYIVHYNDKSEDKPDNQWSLYSPNSPSATTAVISGLKPSAMYNVRISAEFSSNNIQDPSYPISPTRREGDLSEIKVVDVYRRKFNMFDVITNISFLRSQFTEHRSMHEKFK